MPGILTSTLTSRCVRPVAGPLIQSLTRRRTPCALSVVCLSRRFLSSGRSSGVAPAWRSPSAASPPDPAQWRETLRDGLGPAPRVRLDHAVGAQLADHCLHNERRRLYAVYRPCHTRLAAAAPAGAGAGASASASASASAAPTPDDFLALLRILPPLGLADLYAPAIARVLLELLRKPLHPQYGVLSPWDLSPEQTNAVVGEALHLVFTAIPGPAALAWLDELLACRRLAPQRASTPAAALSALSDDAADVVVDPTPEIDLALVCEALRERLVHRPHPAASSATASAASWAIALDAPGAEALVCTPSVVACVAAALIRTGTVASKQAAMDILELAASARFSLVSDVKHGRGGSSRPLALFNEAVAVECAEAAAVVGDSETVARLTFLLYRCRGALGVATLSERTAQSRQHGRPSPAPSDSAATPVRLWDRLVRPLRTTWQAPRPLAEEEPAGTARDTRVWESDDATVADEDELRFERAAVRMLKVAIRAALRHPSTAPSAPDQTSPELAEALALFEALRAGTSWAGTAAMVVELLTYLASVATQQSDVAAAAQLAYRRQALYLLSVLLRGAGSTERQSDGQRRILAVCVARVVEVLLPAPMADVALPSVTSAQAPLILGLFGMVDAAHQEPLLAYALAATVAILVSPPSSSTGDAAVVRTEGQELDSPALHSSLRSLLLREPSASLPTLLRPVNRFFTATATTSTDRIDDTIRGSSSSSSSSASSPSSGALLLLLSLLLRHHAQSDTASMEREGLAALTPLSEQFDRWWAMAGPGSRGLVWQWLLRLQPPSHPLHRDGGEVLMEAITASATATGRAPPGREETTEMVRVLYAYADSRARPLVDTLLTRLFGFTVLTRRTADLLRGTESRRPGASPSARRALVVVGASAVRGTTAPWTRAGEPTAEARTAQGEVQQLQAFLRHVVATSGGSGALRHSSATSAAPATVVVILTLNGLLALPAAVPSSSAMPTEATVHAADALVSPVATALSVQLRGLAPPSTEAAVPVALEVVVLAPLDVGKQSSASSSVPPMDGCVECTALAQDLARQLPVEQRPLLFFWSEELSGPESVGRPAFPAKSAEDADSEGEVGRWLSRHRIRLLSARRVLVERAKLDVIALLRPAPPTSPLTVSTFSASGGSQTTSPRRVAKVLSSDVLNAHRFPK